MDFEYLRLISLDEAESSRLTSIDSETFRMAAEYIAELYSEAKSIENFMTRRGSELIDEIESVQTLLAGIADTRLRKIVRLAEYHVKNSRLDKEQIKLMTPPEKEMYDEIAASISKCREFMTNYSGYMSQQPMQKPVHEMKPAHEMNDASYQPYHAPQHAELHQTAESSYALSPQSQPSVSAAASSAVPADAAAEVIAPIESSESDIQTIDDEFAAEDGLWDDRDFADFAGSSSVQLTKPASSAPVMQVTHASQTECAVSDSAQNSGALTESKAVPADSESLEYEMVCIKENIDSFMGLDEHIYTLSAGDIVTLPRENVEVLCARNIALNIKVSK